MDRTYLFLCLLLCVGLVKSQSLIYRICAENPLSNECQAVELGGSRVQCVRALSSADCALKIQRREADFGMFTEEDLLLLAQQTPGLGHVVASVRKDLKVNSQFAWQAVAVVRSNHTGGLEGLRGKGFCHPGFGVDEQRWSPRVLKHFEEKVAQTGRDCDRSERTPEGVEAAALDRFFKGACRPGPWSSNNATDAALKAKYPKLCSMCNPEGTSNCNYGFHVETVQLSDSINNPHLAALQCLHRGTGDVAYVAWQYVKDFLVPHGELQMQETYSLLCQNGTLYPLNVTTLQSDNPCAWVSQSWPAVVATSDHSATLKTDLVSWMPTGKVPNSQPAWVQTLGRLMFKEPDDILVFSEATPTPEQYVSQGRDIPSIDTTSGCIGAQRWCTTSAQEFAKCQWIRTAAFTLGIEPRISCTQEADVFACLAAVENERADFLSLDTTYGYLARKKYKLGPVLFLQTTRANSSKIVALIKDSSTLSANISRFENLRGKTACFPEFGGIAWVSFVRTAHQIGVISDKECFYSRAISEFFGGACAPGAVDASHTLENMGVDTSKLCSACQAPPSTGILVSSNLTCSANSSNYYYGTNGTLACISSPATDVAFLEVQYAAQYFAALNLDPNMFRVLCKNNTLAQNTGVGVEDDCLLSFVVDGEILARRDYNRLEALRNMLISLDDLFGYSAGSNQLIKLKIFSSFDGVSDLLFKDTAIGMADEASDNQQVKNYVDLWSVCSRSASVSRGSVLMPLLSIATLIIGAKIIF